MELSCPLLSVVNKIDISFGLKRTNYLLPRSGWENLESEQKICRAHELILIGLKLIAHPLLPINEAQ